MSPNALILVATFGLIAGINLALVFGYGLSIILQKRQISKIKGRKR